MAGDFGVSFSPTDQNQQQNQQNGQTPIQDAIKVLNLRIPSFSGGIAPHQLLTAQGSGQFPVNGAMPGGLEALLRRLFGQGGQAPLPSVRPGVNPPTAGTPIGGDAPIDLPLPGGHFPNEPAPGGPGRTPGGVDVGPPPSAPRGPMGPPLNRDWMGGGGRNF